MSALLHLNVHVQPFLREPFESRFVGCSARVFVNDRSINASRMGEFQGAQIIFERVPDYNRVCVDQLQQPGLSICEFESDRSQLFLSNARKPGIAELAQARVRSRSNLLCKVVYDGFVGKHELVVHDFVRMVVDRTDSGEDLAIFRLTLRSALRRLDRNQTICGHTISQSIAIIFNASALDELRGVSIHPCSLV